MSPAAPRSGHRRPRALLVLTTLLAAPGVPAATRPPAGGTLRVAHTGPAELPEPALADTPLEATLSTLARRGPCRAPPAGDAAGRPVPALALRIVRTGPTTLELTLPSPAQAEALARAWTRLAGTEAPSPYRALLAPLVGEGRSVEVRGARLVLRLSGPAPDLERALCHPALAAPSGPGPFEPLGPGAWRAAAAWPEGRAYPDAVRATATDERNVRRLLAARQADVALGLPPSAGPEAGADAAAGLALHATYLALAPRRVPADLRRALEAALDRDELTANFVRGPARPMPHLLPPALLPDAPPAPPRPAPPPPPARRPAPLTLVFDAASEDQRAVAERLQVRLHERGWALALRPESRAALRGRWARGDFELMLHALLLPPAPGPALAVVLDAGGRRDLVAPELAGLGGIADPAARDARARARALALAASVPLVPLYARGLAARAAPGVGGLAFDAQGLLPLDAAWLQPAPPPGAGAASSGGARP